MFSTFTIAAAAAALFASNTLAVPVQERTEYCDPALQPFNLTVTSTNSSKYINAFLAAAHTGAGEEALAVLPSGLSTSFTFNQTGQSEVPGYCGYGYLRYAEPAQPNDVVQQMQFFQNSTSNVQAAFFGTGTTGPVLLAIANEQQELFHYITTAEFDANWYVCPQTTLGYTYETLSHVDNGATPTNPDCEKVRVNKIGGA